MRGFWLRIGGFVAFTIYIVTTFALYVPDWSFVDRTQVPPTKYTVNSPSLYHTKAMVWFGLVLFDSLLIYVFLNLIR